MSEPAPAPHGQYEHPEAVRILQRLAESLDNAEKIVSVMGHRERPACPTCLVAAAWLSQLCTQVWLVRWAFFREVASPTGAPSQVPS